MAMTLTLTYASTTVDLQSGSVVLDGYYPLSPTSEGQETVSEQFNLLISGTAAAIRAKLAAIQRALEMAKAGVMITPVYINWDMDGTGTAYRSKVVNGAYQLTGNLVRNWKEKKVQVGLIIERLAFWEATAWVAVPLTNGNGTDVTTGIKLYNCNDGAGSAPSKNNNYVDIDGVNDILGEMPAPVKMRATVGGAASHFYFGHQVDKAGLGLIQPWDEAEDFTLTSSSDTASGAASGGYYTSYTLVAATEARFYQAIDLSAYSGNYYKFFARFFTNIPSDLKMKIEIQESVSGNVLAESQWVYATTQKLQEIGDLRLPPGREKLPVSGAFESYEINLVLLSAAGGVVDIDDIHWMPTDSYIELGTTLRGIDGDRILYSEGLEAVLYKETVGSAALINYFNAVNGSGIWLIPGINQRIHFLERYNSGATALITSYITLEMWYRPRRRTL